MANGWLYLLLSMWVTCQLCYTRGHKFGSPLQVSKLRADFTMVSSFVKNYSSNCIVGLDSTVNNHPGSISSPRCTVCAAETMKIEETKESLLTINSHGHFVGRSSFSRVSFVAECLRSNIMQYDTEVHCGIGMGEKPVVKQESNKKWWSQMENIQI